MSQITATPTRRSETPAGTSTSPVNTYEAFRSAATAAKELGEKIYADQAKLIQDGNPPSRQGSDQQVRRFTTAVYLQLKEKNVPLPELTGDTSRDVKIVTDLFVERGFFVESGILADRHGNVRFSAMVEKLGQPRIFKAPDIPLPQTLGGGNIADLKSRPLQMSEEILLPSIDYAAGQANGRRGAIAVTAGVIDPQQTKPSTMVFRRKEFEIEMGRTPTASELESTVTNEFASDYFNQFIGGRLAKQCEVNLKDGVQVTNIATLGDTFSDYISLRNGALAAEGNTEVKWLTIRMFQAKDNPTYRLSQKIYREALTDEVSNPSRGLSSLKGQSIRRDELERFFEANPKVAREFGETLISKYESVLGQCLGPKK